MVAETIKEGQPIADMVAETTKGAKPIADMVAETTKGGQAYNRYGCRNNKRGPTNRRYCCRNNKEGPSQLSADLETLFILLICIECKMESNPCFVHDLKTPPLCSSQYQGTPLQCVIESNDVNATG
jgi:hypothetical protein